MIAFTAYIVSWFVIGLLAATLMMFPGEMLLTQRLGVMLAIAALVNLFSGMRAMNR